MIEILAFVLLSLPTAIEAWLDIKDHRAEKRDNKRNDWFVRTGLTIAVSFLVHFLTGKAFWQAALLSTGIFILTFDYIMALLLKKPITYLGTTSKIDRAIKSLPWIFIMMVKIVLFIAAATAYYDLDKILYGSY